MGQRKVTSQYEKSNAVFEIVPRSVETKIANSTVRQNSSKTRKLIPDQIAAVVINLLNLDTRSLFSRMKIRFSEPRKQ